MMSTTDTRDTVTSQSTRDTTTGTVTSGTVTSGTVTSESSQAEAKYALELLSHLNAFRLRSQYTDTTLCVGDHEFPCHRNVLAFSSVFFEAMFSNPLRESREGRVELKGISTNTLRRLLDYVYTGHIEVDRNTAQDTLAAAALYEYPAVVSVCCQFIAGSLDPSNCLGIEAFARHHSCGELEKESRRYIMENFAVIAESEEFRELDVARVTALIACDQIEVQDEEVVFEAAVRWITAEPSREDIACRVLSHVRFAFIDSEYIENIVLLNRLISSCSVCSRLVKASELHRGGVAANAGLLGNMGESLKELAELCDINIVLRPRPSTIAKEVMVVVGGQSDPDNPSILQSVEAYDPLKNKWLALPSLPVAVINFSATTLSNDIYVIGGEMDGRPVSSVWRFVSSKRRWEAAPPLVAPRSCHASAAWETRLYVIGGVRVAGSQGATENEVARSIECLDLLQSEPRWSVVVKEIPFPRQLSQLIPYGPSLVEVGGTVNRFPTKKMEIYECNTTGLRYSGEQYVLLTEIQYAKFVFLDGFFYIIWEDTRRMIAMSPTRRTYKQVSSIGCCHVHGGATVVRHKLYVAGGLMDGRASDVVERYDQERDSWTSCAPMLTRRMRHGCVTISIS